MLRVTTLVAKAGIREQSEMESLMSYLKDKGHLPVIRSMLSGMLYMAKLPEPDEQLTTKIITQASRYLFRRGPEFGGALGDLFFTGELVYILTPMETEMLQTSVIGPGEQKEALQKFCTDIEEGIKTRFDGRRIRGMEFSWRTLPVSLPRYLTRGRYPPFEELFEEEPVHVEEIQGTEPNYDLEDVRAATFLVDTDIRRFILKLAQVGKMVSKDAVDLTKLDTLQQHLSLGLMAEEYLLTCKQDQHTICVVPSKEHLTKEPSVSLRCSVCGRSFPEENFQVIYSLTEKGKKLVEGSLWMSIWITELLKESGVRKEGIKWALEASGEELDLMVEDFDSRLFLELKDREFGLGDAYPFIYRMTRYGGRAGIVATMDKVSTDAKKFFEEENRRREYLLIQYLEGSKNIREGITKVVEEMSLSQVRRTIQPLSVRIGLDLWPIVEYWIRIKQNEISREEVAATADNSG